MIYKSKKCILLKENEFNLIKTNNILLLQQRISEQIPFVCTTENVTYSNNGTYITCTPEDFKVTKYVDNIAFGYFSEQSDSITVSFSSRNISVSVQSTLEADKLTSSICTCIEDYLSSIANKKSKSKSNHTSNSSSKPFYKIKLFWTAVAAIAALLVALTDIITKIFNCF